MSSMFLTPSERKEVEEAIDFSFGFRDTPPSGVLSHKALEILNIVSRHRDIRWWYERAKVAEKEIEGLHALIQRTWDAAGVQHLGDTGGKTLDEYVGFLRQYVERVEQKLEEARTEVLGLQGAYDAVSREIGEVRQRELEAIERTREAHGWEQ